VALSVLGPGRSGATPEPAARAAVLLRWRGPRGLLLGDVLFAVACVVAVGLLLYMNRYATFFNDEWSFILDRRAWTLDAFMRPHNEHWALMPAIVYKVLFATIGLHSYLPYLLVLMAIHVAASTAVYVLMRHRNGQTPALAAGTLMLFLGTGADNLFWAFQIGFVGAAAAGAWAIVLLVTRSSLRAEIGAAALLVVAVATQGTALFFLAATGVMLALDPARWRRLWVVVPATVAFGIWYLAFGSSAIAAHRDPFTLAGLQQVPAYVVAGASHAIGRLTGWGEQVGLVLFVGLGFATAMHVSGRRLLRPAAVAGFVGLIAQFALTGAVRAQLGVTQATSSRYVYVAAILILIAGSGWIGSRFAELRFRPLAVLAAVFVLALGANLSALPAERDAYRLRADATRASIMVIERYGGSPAVPEETGLFPVPPRHWLNEIDAQLGLPLTDALLPDAPPPHPSIVDAQLYQLVINAFTSTTTGEMPPTVMDVAVATSTDVTVTVAAHCIELSVVGPEPQVALRVPGGSALAVEREQFGEVLGYLALNAPPVGASSKIFPVTPGTVQLIGIPDIGETRPWTVRLDPPIDGVVTRVCVVAGSDA
jgi:hypothetical protein